MALADEFVFVNEQAFEADGASCVYFVCAYADFCTESVSVAVAESCGCVPEDIRRVNEVHEFAGGILVGGYD